MSFFCKISITSFVFALLAISTFFFLPQLIQYVINKKIQLSEGSILYPIWKDPPIEIYQSFYFFNVTNHYQIQKHGAKPQLEEIGPFTYKINIDKVILKKDRHDLICFREIRSYHFIRNLSVADDSIQITTLNAPLIIALDVLENLPHLIAEILKTIYHGFFVTKSVRELTFAGYRDRLMDFSKFVIPKAKDRYKGKFGYLVGFNSSDDGVYCVNNGINNIMKINLIESVDGNDSLNLWPGNSCNSFNSSTRGEVSPPMREGPRKSIQIFVPFFCRKFDLNYQKTHRISSDLQTFKYYLDPLNFANSSIYPPNLCYDQKEESPPTDVSQLPSGVFDISPCQYGCPLYISKPHFLGADSFYLSKVEGLQPNVTRHESWIEVEPVSGTSAQVTMRFQASLRTSKKHDLLQSYQIPHMIFPVFWMELSYLIDKNLRQELFIANKTFNLLPSALFISLVSFSILLILLAFLKLFRSSEEGAMLGFKKTLLFWRQTETDQQLLVEPDGDENMTTEENDAVIPIPQADGEHSDEQLSNRAQ